MKHKRLTLKTETIRALTDDRLESISGGIITDTDTMLCTVGTCTAATLGCQLTGPGTADDDNG